MLPVLLALVICSPAYIN